MESEVAAVVLQLDRDVVPVGGQPEGHEAVGRLALACGHLAAELDAGVAVEILLAAIAEPQAVLVDLVVPGRDEQVGQRPVHPVVAHQERVRPQHGDAIVAALGLTPASLAQGCPALLLLVILRRAIKTTSPLAVERLHFVLLAAEAAERGVATALREVRQGPTEDRVLRLRLFGDDPLHEDDPSRDACSRRGP